MMGKIETVVHVYVELYTVLMDKGTLYVPYSFIYILQQTVQS